MQKGQKFELTSFNGTIHPDSDCEEKENYWKLIGQTGTLIKFAEEIDFGDRNRVLIQFDNDIRQQGLECHNPEPNAIWILKTDLLKI